MYTLTCFPRLAVDFHCSVYTYSRGKKFADTLKCSLFLPDDGPTFCELVKDIQQLCSVYGYVLHPSFIPVHDGKAVTLKITF